MVPPRILSSEEAFVNRKSNQFSKWPTRGDSDNRIEPVCKPALSPKFALEPGEKIFTTGSCFARNVEDALAERGFNVVNAEAKNFGPEFQVNRRGILNNYNVASMYNELDWALNPRHPYEEKWNFAEVSPGKYVDLNLPISVRPASLDIVRHRRSLILGLAKQAAAARTVVTTLGLVEAWFDKETDRYINFAPPLSVADKFKKRFELHIFDYETTVMFLEKMINLLAKNAEREQNILMTVSPVPLLATFTSSDVIVANCYSKSVLRVAAEHIFYKYKNVDYYPSYESVTLSDRSLAWRDDQHHVEDAVVRINVGRMIEAYTNNSNEMDVRAKYIEARRLYNARLYQGAYILMEPYADNYQAAPDLVLFAQVCEKLHQPERAKAVLRKITDSAIKVDWRTQLERAKLLVALGEVNEARGLVESMSATNNVAVRSLFHEFLAGLPMVDRKTTQLPPVAAAEEASPPKPASASARKAPRRRRGPG